LSDPGGVSASPGAIPTEDPHE
jgi:hypothetical protein